MSEIEIEIDGQLVKANQGDSIISIADRAVSYTHLTLPTKA